MDLQLNAKVAMITGASRGLGQSMAQALAAEGVRLSICARGDEALARSADHLKAAGAQVLARAADVCDPAAMKSWAEATVKEFGGIDILINNAGGARLGTLAQLSDEAWQEAFNLNFFATVRLSRLCAAEMEKRGGGSIINISSIYGREAGGPLAYNSSKAAMISFTKMLARELAPKHVRVNSIAPGSIIYPGGTWEKAFQANPAFEKDFIAHEFPAGRLGHPEEVAYAVLMLASPRASWITGTCVPVDGGQGRSNI
ncbi:MAG TPA: SDR family NAD(P)-dependent oxidoreductase [Candidatus Binataceae bacterium]|nr:SDR family NAD(P)-dependent oxidoreductase [Candidatus Binataceae bacterium]